MSFLTKESSMVSLLPIGYGPARKPNPLKPLTSATRSRLDVSINRRDLIQVIEHLGIWGSALNISEHHALAYWSIFPQLPRCASSKLANHRFECSRIGHYA